MLITFLYSFAENFEKYRQQIRLFGHIYNFYLNFTQIRMLFSRFHEKLIEIVQAFEDLARESHEAISALDRTNLK